MSLTKEQIKLLTDNNVIVLATSDLENNPRAIFVEINKVEPDKIIITDNQMDRTKNNLLENRKVFIVAFKKDYSYGLKISGEAEYHTEGNYLDFVKNLETNKKFSPKGAIVINIKEIREFT